MPVPPTNKKYGMFDLPESELSREEIIGSKPRAIFEIVCTNYGFDKAAVNKKSFYSWLYRLKKKYRNGAIIEKYNIQRPINIGKGTFRSGNDVIDSFKPTDPLQNPATKTAKPPILKIPEYHK